MPWATDVQADAIPNAVTETTNVTTMALVCLLNRPSDFNFVQSSLWGRNACSEFIG
jgi:hypothetical protein